MIIVTICYFIGHEADARCVLRATGAVAGGHPDRRGARVAEIDLAGNVALDVEVLEVGGAIASNDDFGEQANEQAARDLTAALAAGELRSPIAARFPLDRTADAQDAAERTGAAGRVVIDIADL